MTIGDGTLDCVVVGYNDVSFQDVVTSYAAILTYMDLLNRSLEGARGRDPALHVAKMPSLGAWHLRSFLTKNGYRAEVVNAFNFEQDLLLELLARKPKCVAITTTFYLDAKPVREIVTFVRRHAPDVRIVVGGPHVFNVCEFYGADDDEGLLFVLEEMGADIYIMNKSASVDKYVHAIGELNSRGIITFACLIAGFPGETEETFRNTVDFVRQSKPLYFRAELYYHAVNAPIHARASEFGLKGAGFSWSHRSMDWKGACRCISTMYQDVNESTVLPVYMYDFWGIPYLMGQGVTKQQMLEFNRGAGAWLRDDLAHHHVDEAAALNRLTAIFRE